MLPFLNILQYIAYTIDEVGKTVELSRLLHNRLRYNESLNPNFTHNTLFVNVVLEQNIDRQQTE